ncbi:hypothetical protein [Streptomyces sp. NPDC018031]|uniref:hypothetical protein n=1 Tax=Streptomyces sp. NPDC018031 TaxID=3365033 RepID=UPI003796E6DF
MSTSPTPAVPGARPGASALAVLACTGAALFAAAPGAAAAPGDGGDVKVRSAGAPIAGQRDDSRVCEFYLLGKNFDSIQELTYSILPLGVNVEVGGLSGGISLAGGLGRTERLTLPDGEYRLTWNREGTDGVGKQKVFRVDCGAKNAASASPAAGSPGTQGTQSTQADPGGSGEEDVVEPESVEEDEVLEEDGTLAADGSDSFPGADGPDSSGTDRASGTEGRSGAQAGAPAEAHTDTGAPLRGPVGAGGGGTADDGSDGPGAAAITGTLAAGVAGVAGLYLVRRARRRTHGAA